MIGARLDRHACAFRAGLVCLGLAHRAGLDVSSVERRRKSARERRGQALRAAGAAWLTGETFFLKGKQRERVAGPGAALVTSSQVPVSTASGPSFSVCLVLFSLASG